MLSASVELQHAGSVEDLAVGMRKCIAKFFPRWDVDRKGPKHCYPANLGARCKKLGNNMQLTNKKF